MLWRGPLGMWWLVRLGGTALRGAMVCVSVTDRELSWDCVGVQVRAGQQSPSTPEELQKDLVVGKSVS